MTRIGGRNLATVLLLAGLTFAAFWPVLSAGFTNFDDDLYVTENPHVRQGLTAGTAVWSLTATRGANWHPLTWLSHASDVDLYGLDPRGHHLTSLIFHALDSALLFFVLLRASGTWGPSAFAAALFAVHPLHVESVAWIAERKDVLSTMLWLAATWAYLGYARKRSPLRLAAVAALMAAGLAAKPMLVTLPFVLLILDAWPLARRSLGWPRLVLEKLPLFALSLASSAVTMAVQRKGGAMPANGGTPLPVRLATAVVAYASYLVKTVWPVRLCAFYPHPGVAPPAWQVGSAAVLLAAISALAWRLRARYPYLPAGWLWYLGTLVPVIGLVQVGEQWMADRYTYVPLIGIFVIVAWGSRDLALRFRGDAFDTRTLAVPAGVILVALAIASRAQAAVWNDSVTLFTRVLAVTPPSTTGEVDLGDALEVLGRTAEAREHFEAALRIDPRNRAANNRIAGLLVREGALPEAIACYERALAGSPEDPDTLSNLGIALAKAGRLPEAIERLTEALRADTEGRAAIRTNLGNALLLSGRRTEAAERYREALRLDPGNRDARANLDRALRRPGP